MGTVLELEDKVCCRKDNHLVFGKVVTSELNNNVNPVAGPGVVVDWEIPEPDMRDPQNQELFVSSITYGVCMASESKILRCKNNLEFRHWNLNYKSIEIDVL